MGSSTRLFSIEMNVEVSTSVVRWVVVAFYLRYIAISLRCSTERNLSGRFVSLAAWQFLLCHRFVPE